jgi:hypothetical protein
MSQGVGELRRRRGARDELACAALQHPGACMRPLLRALPCCIPPCMPPQPCCFSLACSQSLNSAAN